MSLASLQHCAVGPIVQPEKISNKKNIRIGKAEAKLSLCIDEMIM